MKIYVVFDTNVLVSAMLKKYSTPWILVQNLKEGRIQQIVNLDILEEYKEVLARKKFNFPQKMVDEMLFDCLYKAIWLDGIQTDFEGPDPKDIVFYEVVMDARQREEAYLVTENKKHFPIKPYVVTPRELLDILENLPE